ncbi:MAG TPA: hypothetical protein V6D29_02530 [Leptolyngbyaceae cyanobacterium]
MGIRTIKEWNFHEYSPSTHSSYSDPDGGLYAYRLSDFPYLLLRKNGVSPIVLIDIVNYDYNTRLLKSYSSGLVNKINSDSVIHGVVAFRLTTTGFIPENLNQSQSPPNNWNDLEGWLSNLQERSPSDLAQVHGDWTVLGKNIALENTFYRVSVSEKKCLWKMAKNYELQDAYLLVIDVVGEANRSCQFSGIAYGSRNSRLKTALNFIDGVIAPTINLGTPLEAVPPYP